MIHGLWLLWSAQALPALPRRSKVAPAASALHINDSKEGRMRDKLNLTGGSDG
jgi:hypothetical protein